MNEKHLLDAHVVGVDVLRVLVKVVVEVDHFLVSLVQVGLVLQVQVVPGILELANLILNHVEVLVHQTCVLLVGLRNVLYGLGKLTLVLDVAVRLVLHVPQPLLYQSALRTRPGDLVLLLVEVFRPLGLHRSEIL